MPARPKSTGLLGMFHPDMVKRMDHLALLFSTRWPLSHIPELYEIFGKEKLVEFLDIFAGVTVKVPSRNDVEKAVRDHCIYHDMSDGETLPVVAGRYKVSPFVAKQAYYRMYRLYKGLKSEVPSLDGEGYSRVEAS